MMTKIRKYFLMMVMVLISILPVFADTTSNVVDFSKKGSLSIALSETITDTKVKGADIVIYKVADAYSLDYNLAFDYEDSLEKHQEELEDGKITHEILESVKTNKVSNLKGVTNVSGIVSFSELDLGLYLVTQSNQVDGYSDMDPFLVMIPQVYDNQWLYDIEATPKVEIIRLFDLSVEKVWNVSTDTKIPEQINVSLLKDGEVLDTVSLNQQNNWSYTWKQIEMSDEYSILEVDVPEGYTVTYEQDENHFIVTNTKSLVQTGQLTWLVAVFASVGLFLIVIGLFWEKRKRYE